LLARLSDVNPRLKPVSLPGIAKLPVNHQRLLQVLPVLPKLPMLSDIAGCYRMADQWQVAEQVICKQMGKLKKDA
jgi:hypothetical protein